MTETTETVTVCASCLTEECVAGVLMCEGARQAGTTIVRRASETARVRPMRPIKDIAGRIDQIIGWAKTGERRDHYVMEREHVDRMRDDILSYAFGEAAISELEKS
jgi:hypothetical protein